MSDRNGLRQGTTLAEMLVMLTLTSVILSTVAMLTHGLFTSTRRLVEEGEMRRAASRLQLQMLADASIALSLDVAMSDGSSPESLTSAATENQWTWRFADGKFARYQLQGRSIERILHSAASPDTPEPPIEHRDQFRLPSDHRFVLAERNTAADPIVLSVSRPDRYSQSAEPTLLPTGVQVVAFPTLTAKTKAEGEEAASP